MADDKRKLQENESSVSIVDLPGVKSEFVLAPGRFVITEGFDFGFVKDFWDGVKKIAHKIGIW
jgi:hypothetical protein